MRRPPAAEPTRTDRSTPWACAALAAALSMPAAARCLDEGRIEGQDVEPAVVAPQAPPRQQLQDLVRDALARSQAVGATALLAEAALQDIEEARAGKAVQASIGGGFGPGGSNSGSASESATAQLRAGVNISQLLYDSGRTDRLLGWRQQLAESARYGHLSEQEQVALTTVTLALERSRFRMQLQVYRQQMRTMGCLVEALDTIVRTDRGRASELVQARKSLEQAELSQTQTQSSLRQIEVRLRRLVGDGLPGTEGLASVFSVIPPQEQLLADVERAYEVAQLDAQAAAAARYADFVGKGAAPSLSWSVNTSSAISLGNSGSAGGTTRSGSYSVGVTVSVPILAPSVAPATEAARKRAQASALQRADAVESRRYRLAEVWEQSQSGMDRAKRLIEVLKSSEQLRNFTLQQWQQLGRRSLFDVMAAQNEHYSLRVAYVNALHDVQQLNANLLSLGRGVNEWLR